MNGILSHLKNPLSWLHGLIAAMIGGAANSVCAGIVDPDSFNLETWAGFATVLKLFLVSGFLNAMFYLKNSPVPDLAYEDKTRAGFIRFQLLLGIASVALAAFFLSSCAGPRNGAAEAKGVVVKLNPDGSYEFRADEYKNDKQVNISWDGQGRPVVSSVYDANLTRIQMEALGKILSGLEETAIKSAFAAATGGLSEAEVGSLVSLLGQLKTTQEKVGK